MRRIVLAVIAVLGLWASESSAVLSGQCAIWAYKRAALIPKNFPGSQVGYDSAKVYVGKNGLIMIHPGCEGIIAYGTLSDSVLVYDLSKGEMKLAGARATTITPRLGPASSAGSGGAIRIVDGVTFPMTRDGIRAAINDLPAVTDGNSSVNGSSHAGTVVLTSGEYSGTGTIPLHRGLTIIGQGDASGILVSSATDTVFLFRGPNAYEARVQNLSFSGVSGDGVGLFFDDVIDSWVSGVHGRAKLYFQNCGSTKVTDCVANVSNFVLNSAQECTFTNCLGFGSTSGNDGWLIQNSVDNTFTGCEAIKSDRNGFSFVGNSDRNTMLGCTVRSASYGAVNTYSGIRFDATSDSNRVLAGQVGNYLDLRTYEAHAKYGIEITTGATLNQFVGVKIGQQATGEVADNGTNTGWVNCIGSPGLTIPGKLGILTVPADGNAVRFSRPSFNYLTATDASGSLILQSGGSNTVMEVPSTHDGIVVTGFGRFSDSLRTNKGLYLGGRFVNKIDGGSATLNFGVPAAVPGSVDATIAVAGVAFGDQPIVGAPVTIGANYVLTAFVSVAGTLTIRWTQIAGAAADPDGAGGSYTVRFLR